LIEQLLVLAQRVCRWWCVQPTGYDLPLDLGAFGIRRLGELGLHLLGLEPREACAIDGRKGDRHAGHMRIMGSATRFSLATPSPPGHLPTNEKASARTHMAMAITDVHFAKVR
jgi:hypothetical protein